MKSSYTAYREAEILGKGQLDLLLDVYDGAIRAYAGARSHYAAGKHEAGYEDLQQARRFLMHLYTTLDFDNGGEVAANLGNLYAFVLNQTSLIEASKDVKRIDSNIKILRNLKAGWVDLKARVKESGAEVAAATEQGPAALTLNTSA